MGRTARPKDENGKPIYTAEELAQQEEKKVQKEIEKANKLKLEKEKNQQCDTLVPLTKGEYQEFLNTCEKNNITSELALKLLIQGFSAGAIQLKQEVKWTY